MKLFYFVWDEETQQITAISDGLGMVIARLRAGLKPGDKVIDADLDVVTTDSARIGLTEDGVEQELRYRVLGNSTRQAAESLLRDAHQRGELAGGRVLKPGGHWYEVLTD